MLCSQAVTFLIKLRPHQTLRVVHFSRQLSFVNVDAYSPKGIQRAKNLNLITSGLADVVMSPLLHDAAALFTPTHKGRLFTMLRHPIERATSLFYFIQDTQWKEAKTRNDQFADMTIESKRRDFIASGSFEFLGRINSTHLTF